MNKVKEKQDENRVDETSMESFPASDPPSWTPVFGTMSENVTEAEPDPADSEHVEDGDHDDQTQHADYNYLHFSFDDSEFTHFNALEPETPLPDMVIMNTKGEPFNLADLAKKGKKRFVLETGSITCPMFMANNKAMNELADAFLDTTFCVLYTREAHPGKLIPRHASIASKLLNARRMEQLVSESRRVIVDQLEGGLHLLLGGMPNSVFVFSGQGTLKYRANWNDPDQIKTLLSGLTVSERDAPVNGILPPKYPPIQKALPVLLDAGHEAAWDVLKSLPTLLAKRKDVRKWMKSSVGQDISL